MKKREKVDFCLLKGLRRGEGPELRGGGTCPLKSRFFLLTTSLIHYLLIRLILFESYERRGITNILVAEATLLENINSLKFNLDIKK